VIAPPAPATGATKALPDVIKPIPAENAAGTIITNAPITARYVRFVIEKFQTRGWPASRGFSRRDDLRHLR